MYCCTFDTKVTDFDFWQGHMCFYWQSLFAPVIRPVLPTFQELLLLFLQTERKLINGTSGHSEVKRTYPLHSRLTAATPRQRFTNESLVVLSHWHWTWFWSASISFTFPPNRPLKNLYIQVVPGGNVSDFGRMFLRLKYTDITQNTYIWSWTVTEIMARVIWNYVGSYTLIDHQMHVKTGWNMWFL